MFQGKFEINQIQPRGDMNEGGIVSLSQILEGDRPLPTSEGIGAPLYVAPPPPSLPPSLAKSQQKECRHVRFLAVLGGGNAASAGSLLYCSHGSELFPGYESSG